MNIFLKFDPEGGDLGRGVKVTALELVVIVPHIAEILSKLRTDNPYERLSYKYGFEVWLADKDRLTHAIADTEKSLPENVKWYEIEGRKVFELRGASGGVTSALACYLVTK